MKQPVYKNSFRIALSADFCNVDGNPAFPDLGLSILDPVRHLTYGFLPEYHAEYLPSQLAGLDVLIALKPKVTARSLEGADRLTAIGRCGVGFDNVDLEACTRHGVAVFITPQAVARPVAESIVLFILALSHRLVSKDRLMRKSLWTESSKHLGREPRDRVVGTIGMGNIASEAIRLLKPFHVASFIAFDPFVSAERVRDAGVELVSLEVLLRKSDYVVVNCPLNSQTRGLIGKAQFALMKPDAVLINTARGPIVDEGALIHALQSGTIAGAALDVFEYEPLAKDSPLLALDNVILSSHSIAWTEELFRDMGRADCEGALAIYRGEVPAHIVNPAVLENKSFLNKLEGYKNRAWI